MRRSMSSKGDNSTDFNCAAANRYTEGHLSNPTPLRSRFGMAKTSQGTDSLTVAVRNGQNQPRHRLPHGRGSEWPKTSQGTDSLTVAVRNGQKPAKAPAPSRSRFGMAKNQPRHRLPHGRGSEWPIGGVETRDTLPVWGSPREMWMVSRVRSEEHTSE